MSEEYGQPSARAGGSDAFKGANITHPTPPNLRAAVGAAGSPQDGPRVGGARRAAGAGRPPARLAGRLGTPPPPGSPPRRAAGPPGFRRRGTPLRETSSSGQLGNECHLLHLEPGKGGSCSSDGSAGALAFVQTTRPALTDFASSGEGDPKSQNRYSKLKRGSRLLFSGSRAARRRRGRKGRGSPGAGCSAAYPRPPRGKAKAGDLAAAAGRAGALPRRPHRSWSGAARRQGGTPREGGQAQPGSLGPVAPRAPLGRGGAAAA